ncbi:hypothetical protein BDR07DRAFT_1401972 [Suillus spraguei]|nr:hypothetical protein BDR07DRAFT_1401972 [Suillus spraguei]
MVFACWATRRWGFRYSLFNWIPQVVASSPLPCSSAIVELQDTQGRISHNTCPATTIRRAVQPGLDFTCDIVGERECHQRL